MEDGNKENNMVKYDAFISYRHSEIDAQAAEDIQRRLERYKIPKAIRKKTGKQRIERVFRDKDELPTTSDLNDDIGNALKNSEYLIVICSPRLKESSWCLKEIETFLKYHDRNHVMTVLAEGEPYDVIPDILLHEDVVAADGTVERKAIEPLSCDYRLSKSKRIRTEFPRLAAIIIGCSYNDLIQRRKQYQQRRMMAIAVAAFAIIAFFLIYAIQSNVRINENYNQSLVNQSLYLTKISHTLLEKGDREGAIKTALAALPDEDNERPLVNEPLYALNNALYTYQFNVRNTFYAIGSLESQSMPSGKIVYNDSCAAYAMIDKGGCGYVVDKEGNTILFESRPIDIYELDTGDFRDVYAYKEGFLFFDENAFYYVKSSGEVAYYIEYAEFQEAKNTAYNVNGDTIVIAYPSMIMIFNAEDGSVIREIETESWDSVPGICFSPSGDRFALYSAQLLLEKGFLYLCDIESGEIKMINDDIDITDACFVDEDTLALIESPYMGDYYYSNMDDYYKSTIKCLDLNSGKILWEMEEGSVHAENEKSKLSLYNWADSDEVSLLLTAGNEMKIFNLADGSSQFCMYYGAQIVSAEEWVNSTIMVVLNDGSIYQQYTDESELRFSRGGISADITSAADDGEGSILVGCNDDRRYVMLSTVEDEDVAVLENEIAVGTFVTGGDIDQKADIPNYIYAEYDDGSLTYNGLRVWNGDTLEVVFDYYSDRETRYSDKVHAEYKNGELYLIIVEYCVDDEHSVYYHLFKVSSGEEITKAGGVPCDEYADCVWIQDEDLLCACCNFDYLIFYDYEGNIVRTDKVDGSEEFCYVDEAVSMDGGKYICMEGTEGEEKEIRVYDTVNNKWVRFETYESMIPVDGYGRFALAKNHNKLLVYTEDYRLLIFDLESGKIEREIPFNGATTSAFDWFDNDSKLILMGDDYYIKLWDVEKNELIIQESERTEAASISGSVLSQYFMASTNDLTASTYIYQVDEDGSFHKYAAISSGKLNYFNQQIVLSSNNEELAVSHIYSLEELREKAKKVIGDAALTDEEKAQYFIN